MPFPSEHPVQMPQMFPVVKFPELARVVFRVKFPHAKHLAAIFATSMNRAAATSAKNTSSRFSGFSGVPFQLKREKDTLRLNMPLIRGHRICTSVFRGYVTSCS